MYGPLAMTMTPARLLGTFQSLDKPTCKDCAWLESESAEVIRIAYIHPVGTSFLFDQHHPRPDPVRAYAVLALSEDGDPVDILALDPADEVTRGWTGAAWAWGAETIWRPRLSITIPIHRTFRGRLRANLDGFVPLRPKTLLHHVLGIPALIAEDRAHRAQLQRHFQASLPRILVPGEVRK